MAYISQQEKQQLAPGIRAVLKKYNLKGSISIQHHSVLTVKIRSGDISLDDFRQYDPASSKTTVGSSRQYLQFTDHISDRYVTGQMYQCLIELVAAMKGADWYDRSDSMTDYFDIAHYVNIHFGAWNKPYQCTRQPVPA